MKSTRLKIGKRRFENKEAGYESDACVNEYLASLEEETPKEEKSSKKKGGK